MNYYCAMKLSRIIWLGIFTVACSGGINKNNSVKVDSNNIKPILTFDTNYYLPNKLAYSEYLKSKTPSDLLLFDTIYFIGWSRSGNIAYLRESANQAGEDYQLELVIADLERSILVDRWSLSMNLESKLSITKIWNSNYAIIKSKLMKNKIHQVSVPALKKMDELQDEIEIRNVYSSENILDIPAISSSKIISKRNKKILFEKKFDKYDLVQSQILLGYLQNPFNKNQKAILLSTVYRGWEGPPDVNVSSFFGYTISE